MEKSLLWKANVLPQIHAELEQSIDSEATGKIVNILHVRRENAKHNTSTPSAELELKEFTDQVVAKFFSNWERQYDNQS